MTDCTNTEAREALPDLANGRLGQLDTATMNTHVESCASCRAELALLRAVRDSAPLAPKMDAQRISAAILPYGGAGVLTQLPTRPAASFSRRYVWQMGVLAALLIAIGGISIFRPGRTAVMPFERTPVASGPMVAAAPPVIDTVPALAATQAKPPTRAVSGTRPTAVEERVAMLSLVGGTQDLTESQLETLLSELDGMESIPSAEPQTVTPSVEGLEGDQ